MRVSTNPNVSRSLTERSLESFARQLETVNRFVRTEQNVRPLGAPIHLQEGKEAETGEDLGGILVGENVDERGVGVRGT